MAHRISLVLALMLTACVDDPTAIDDVETSTIDSELTASQWGAGVLVKNSSREHHTGGDVAMTLFGQKLFALYPSPNSPGLFKFATYQGNAWSPQGDVINMLASGPFAITVHENLLTVIYAKSSGYLYMMTKGSAQYAPWSEPVPLTAPDRVYTGFGIASLSGKLYLASSDGGEVFLSRLDGTTLTNIWSHSLEESYNPAVTLGVVNGKLRAFWIDETITWGWTFPYGIYGEIWHDTVRELVAKPGSTYVVNNNIGMESITPPVITTCNGYAHLIHRGSGSNLWWASMPVTGTAWSTDHQLSHTSSIDPAIACNAYVIPSLLYGSSDTERMWLAEFR